MPYITRGEFITYIIPGILFVIFFILTWYRRRKASEMMKDLTIIPEFDLGTLKFYEVAAFVDRKLTTRDMAALAVYYFLNPSKVKDPIEQHLFNNYSNKAGLEKIKNDFIKEEGFVELRLSFNMTSKIYERMVKDGFFVYNPYRIIVYGFSYILGLIVIDAFTEKWVPPLIKYSLWALLIFSMIVVVIFSLFAFEFHEKLNRIIEFRRKILGYKMFLKTTDYYKVKKDQETYEKYMPYFILFGYYKNEWDDMLEYCIEKAK